MAGRFQLLLKGCTIEAGIHVAKGLTFRLFQLLLKGCTIEAKLNSVAHVRSPVSVVVERMYD